MASTDPALKRFWVPGMASGCMAFLSWGLVPAYWKQLIGVSALHILAHRALWSLVFLVGLLSWQGHWRGLGASLARPRQAANSLAGTLAITANWFIFIWAVNEGYVLETSLGYFLTPLLNVLLGAVVMGERLRPLQKVAVGLAAAGVLNRLVGYGHVPWIALGLCVSFGFYGLLRKRSSLESIPGLFVETALMLPLALGYILYGLMHDPVVLQTVRAPSTAALLVGGGLVTALPLIWFGKAARHLPLSTLATLQYLGPTVSFLLGVFVYHEAFTAGHAVTFALIWAGIALNLYELRRA